MKNLFSTFKGIRSSGEPYRRIAWYWLPELISATILVSLPPIIDSYTISQLKSTMIYGAMGMGVNFLHMLIKISEAIPVGAIAIIGRHNGAEEYERCGEGLADTFWTTFLFGMIQFMLVFACAKGIYSWLGVPQAMIEHGTPFLQLKSLGMFFAFITLGLLGFMRAVKNTRMPMFINMLGIATFIVLDIGLVLGRFGMPSIGLMGSAWASVAQNIIMCGVALGYILFNPDYKKYFPKLFFGIFSGKRILRLLNMSWPVIIDKATIAMSYIWLSKMITPLGEYAIVSYDVIKNLERFAFLPVITSAIVITFLVSNSLGARDYDGALSNIKKVYLFTCATLFPCLLLLITNSSYFISFFDPLGKFTSFAASILPVVSILLVFDFTQVVLAGALRGAGDVRTVMAVRAIACGMFFFPVSWLLANCSIQSAALKFTLVYGSFYITTGLISLAYLYRIKSRAWQKSTL